MWRQGRSLVQQALVSARRYGRVRFAGRGVGRGDFWWLGVAVGELSAGVVVLVSSRGFVAVWGRLRLWLRGFCVVWVVGLIRRERETTEGERALWY